MTLRRWLRRVIPTEVRLRFALARRGARDIVARTRIGDERSAPLAVRFAAYELTIRHYPGQEATAEGKRTNQRLMARDLDGALVRPGEVFSLWRYAGRPTRAMGYQEAAALIDGQMTTDIGGATCLVATVIYNSALLAGFEIAERACHSLDSYGDERYFEIGRDAVIEYGYRDLRLRNPHPYALVLGVTANAHRVAAWFTAQETPAFAVALEVSGTTEADGRHGVKLWRRTQGANGDERREDLGWSWYG